MILCLRGATAAASKHDVTAYIYTSSVAKERFKNSLDVAWRLQYVLRLAQNQYIKKQ